MLLRHVVIFLNFILMAAPTKFKMMPGWVGNSGPRRGVVYWLLPSVLDKVGHRLLCVVLYKLKDGNNLYRIARMYASKDLENGLPATQFFEKSARLLVRTDGEVRLNKYLIFPRETHDIQGDPKAMGLINGYVTEMPKVDWGRLVVASGIVDGWKTSQQTKPLPGGFYWIHSQVLGIKGKAGLYIPCVVIPSRVEHKYRAVRMSTCEHPNGYPATNFFGKDVDLKTGIPITNLDDLKNYYIHPLENYDVDGDPKIIQRWGEGNLLKMPQDGVDRLVAVTFRVVDGWGAGKDGPLLRHVYWVRSQVLEIKVKYGVYTPCVVVRRVGNKYRVIAMSTRKDPNGYRATDFFAKDANLQTGIPIIKDLENYYIYPRQYELKGDPKILQRWESVSLLEMPKEGLNRLVAASGMVDGWGPGRRGPRLGGVYWVRSKDLGINAKIGVYTPCVIICEVDTNKYRVVKLSSQFGPSASMYFENNAKLQTPAGIAEIRTYYLRPSDHYDVEGDPKIIQRWEEGEITQMLEYRREELERLVFPDRHKPTKRPKIVTREDCRHGMGLDSN